jgi:ribonuclease HII
MGFILGIDEAGRGAVIGPLVITGLLIKSYKEKKLKELGVKDSKKLTSEKREELAKKIKKISDDYIIFKISSKQLNYEMKRKNLNEIEIVRIVQIINSFWIRRPKIFIDSVEANVEKFKSKILAKLKNKEIEIIAENFADEKFVVVSGASILAKVERDKEIRKLHEKYGYFGSGYPGDERTIEFLKNLDRTKYNEIVRLRWITSDRILEERDQRKLLDF